MDKGYEEEELKQAFKVTVDLYDDAKLERDKLEVENIKLEIANRKLTNALEMIANSRGMFSHELIEMAKQALAKAGK